MLTVFSEHMKTSVKKNVMILCYFNDKTRTETETYVDRSGTVHVCWEGGGVFEMCGMARKITLENILRRAIGHQIH